MLPAVRSRWGSAAGGRRDGGASHECWASGCALGRARLGATRRDGDPGDRWSRSIGVALSTSAVNYLTDDLQPAAAANQAVYQDLTDMSAAVEAWSSTGLPGCADDYRQALAPAARARAGGPRVRRAATPASRPPSSARRRAAQALDRRLRRAARSSAEGGVGGDPAGGAGSGTPASTRSAAPTRPPPRPSTAGSATASAAVSRRLKGTVLAVRPARAWSAGSSSPARGAG